MRWNYATESSAMSAMECDGIIQWSYAMGHDITMDECDILKFVSTLDLHDASSCSQSTLSQLGFVVNEAARDHEIRVRLTSTIPHIMNQIANVITSNTTTTTTHIYYLRLVRGCLLLIRNLTIEKPEVDVSAILNSFRSFKLTVSRHQDPDIYDKLVVAYYQTLCNVSQYKPFDPINEFYDVMEPSELSMSELKFPIALLVFNLFRDPANIYELLHSTTGKDHTIVDHMINEFTISDLELVDKYQFVLIDSFLALISHESFSNWMSNWMSNHSITDARFEKLLKISQIIIGSRENWDNSQLIGILSWILTMFYSYKDLTIQAFEAEQVTQLNQLHLGLLIVLDCISELSKFNLTKDFLISYKMVDQLVPLLRIIHENIGARNMMKKTTGSQDLDIEFPHIKSIIIEILSYLSYDNFDIQERIRELHGLELVLSNCVIDDNNPFIKERAIICLKYLLYKNRDNQEFVRSLEARKLVDQEVLDEINGEVKIENGNLQLKN